MNNHAISRIMAGLAMALFISCAESDRKEEDRVSSLLQQTTIPVTSLDTTFSAEFKDQLKEELKDVRVLALGEATHEDGTTLHYKTELVKFLHEEMDFDVLAFEFGFYGNWNTSEKLKRRENLYEAIKYSGWARSKFALPVYEYMSRSYDMDEPLMYAGFDSEKVPDGIPNIRDFLVESRKLTGIDLVERDSLVMDSLVVAVYDRLGSPMKKMISYGARSRALALIDSIATRISNDRETLETALDPHTIAMYQLTLRSIVMDEKSAFAGAYWNIVRDKHMADRVVWLTDSLYRGKKIILWGASAHFARNMVQIDRTLGPDDYGFYPYYQMGDWLREYYKDAYYAMAFVSASGSIGTVYPEDHSFKPYEQIIPIDTPVPGSFEEVAFTTGEHTLFCNLRTLPEDSWLRQDFTAFPFGYQRDSTSWSNVIDGIFYIREMEPDEYMRLPR